MPRPFPPAPSSTHRRQLRAQLVDPSPTIRATARETIISSQISRLEAFIALPVFPATATARHRLHRYQLSLSRLYIPLARLWVSITCWRGREAREMAVRGFVEYQEALEEASRRVLGIGEEEEHMGCSEVAGWAVFTMVLSVFNVPGWIRDRVMRATDREEE